MNKLTETIEAKQGVEFNIDETMQQLKAGRMKFWRWGAECFTNYKDLALVFKVNGNHHKGLVLITMDWSDTYSFYLLDYDGNVLYEQDQVYCDTLVDSIDHKVERIAAYRF